MTTRAIACPNCGAEVQAGGFEAIVVCASCSTANYFHLGQLKSAGPVAPIADMPSRFRLGMHGRIKGVAFEVVGRVRYEYADGGWNEWNLVFGDGTIGWLHEDEGELSLMVERMVAQGPLSLAELRIGEQATFQLGAEIRHLFVQELGRATPVSGEGRITSELQPNVPFDYADGFVGDKEAVLLSTHDHHVLFVGFGVEHHEVETPR